MLRTVPDTTMHLWMCLVLSTLSICQAIFVGGEQDIASPLRVAQCRATCLEKVTFSVFLSLNQVFSMYLKYK